MAYPVRRAVYHPTGRWIQQYMGCVRYPKQARVNSQYSGLLSHTSVCLSRSFTHPAAIPWFGSLCADCTQSKQLCHSHLRAACAGSLLPSCALPPAPAQEATWAWPNGTSSHSRREYRREEGKHWHFQGALPFCGSLLRQTLFSRALSRTGALLPQISMVKMFQTLCFKSLSPFASCRDMVIIPSPPPSQCTSVMRSPLLSQIRSKKCPS